METELIFIVEIRIYNDKSSSNAELRMVSHLVRADWPSVRIIVLTLARISIW
jgi:hypothetical protein